MIGLVIVLAAAGVSLALCFMPIDRPPPHGRRADGEPDEHDPYYQYPYLED